MKILGRLSCAAALLLAGSVPLAFGEVVAAGNGGFVSEHELLLNAPPDRVYEALTGGIHAWWDPSHSYSGDSSNFYLEARALGCFCERLPDGGSIAHMQVAYARPGKMLRLIGGLGPLQAMGASGTMEFRLQPIGGGTLLNYRYSVVGFSSDGMSELAEPVDRVQLGQLQRLKSYLDRSPGGKPADAEHL